MKMRMNEKQSKCTGGLHKAVFILLIAVGAVGCTTGKIDHNFENMVYVNQSSLELYLGDTQQLTASPTESTFEWISDDPSIATVDENGLVAATGVGFTQITVKQGEWMKQIDVKVSLPTAKSVLARAGNKRVLLEVNIANEKVQKVDIVCQENNRSVEHAVNYKKGLFEFSFDNLEEGQLYHFSVTCIDRSNEKAAPINVTANVYGDSFQSSLTNRAVDVATCFGNGLIVKWKDAAGDCVFTYTDENGKKVKAFIPSSEKNTYLKDFGKDLSYATYAVPENNAADTFYVAPVALVYEDLRPILTSTDVCEIPIINFDLGGEGVAFHDTTVGNQGGNDYRKEKGDPSDEGVDIESGLNIGYTVEDEWQMFTVYVQDAGVYAFDLRRSVNNTNGGYYFLEVDGEPITPIYMVNDDDWGAHKWQHETYPVPDNQPRFNFTKGKHIVKFVVGRDGGFNYTHIRFTPVK